MRILIADSNPARMDLYKRILEQDKHEILTAKNRIEASLAYKRSEIDVVVLTLGTPDRIEDLVKLYGTPIVAISASKEEEKAFSDTNFTIRKFDENNLRYAVNRVSLELAVA